MITGCCLGMLLFSTYLLRSGTGGHWVFSIYWLRSGGAAQGGTVAFRTYLLMSGCAQGGHTNWFTLVHVFLSPAPLSHCSGQVHWGAGLLHTLQEGIVDSNPSILLPPKYFPRPKPTPRIRTARASKRRGVNFVGIYEAIPLLMMDDGKIIGGPESRKIHSYSPLRISRK